MKEVIPVQVTKDAKALMRIVDAQWKRPSEILARYLKKVTGADFMCSNVQTVDSAFVFTVRDYGDSGFGYRIEGQFVYIEAKNEQAAVYAVYDFLERIVGCRYYTSTEEYVPYNRNLWVSFEDYSYTPVMQYREVYYRDFESRDFAEKHKVALFAAKEDWGLWCHTFERLVDPKVYYKDHPEYFALDQGERIGEHGQLCLSNPEVLEVLVENLFKEMEKKPQCKYWSVSQNDNPNYCHCPECEKMNAEDGGPMGAELQFVNKVAARVAERYPDKVVSTLAYWYTRKAPKVTRPADNVSILLCNIEANRGEPIETDPRSAGSKQELLDWADICGNVFLWDYCIQFRNLVAPFPNLRVIPKNIRFFAEHNVRSLFSQGNGDKGGEFSALRGYLLAKMMWDPYCDGDAVINEFLQGYYKGAGKYIRAYIDTMHDAMEAAGGELHIFGCPLDTRESYFTEELFRKYSEQFDAAEAAAADDPEILLRVRTARMPVWYSAIYLGYGTKAEQYDMIAKFAAQARKTGLEKVEEWHIRAEEFITDSLAKLAED